MSRRLPELSRSSTSKSRLPPRVLPEGMIQGLTARLNEAIAGCEGKDVYVRIAFQHTLVGGICIRGIIFRCGGNDVRQAGFYQRCGRARGIATIIGAVGDFAGNSGEVILGIIGQIIIALAPLADVTVVTGAHERSHEVSPLPWLP